MKTTIENMVNIRGNRVKNQFIMRTEGKVVFISYESTIATYDNCSDTITLCPNYKCSQTTKRYLLLFVQRELGKDVKTIKDIEKMSIILKEE